MASIFLLGTNQKALEFLEAYINEHQIAPYDVERLTDLKVEDVREIKKKLSFKSVNNRLFYFSGEITVEAQNALLKIVEEHAGTTHFVFSAEKEEFLLPTMRSRCRLVHLGGTAAVNEEIGKLVTLLYSKSESDWGLIEELAGQVSQNGTEVLVAAMRGYVLSNIHDKKNMVRGYKSCKKLLTLLPLVSKNNVNIRTVLEKTFEIGSF
jgi:hypothetical protein